MSRSPGISKIILTILLILVFLSAGCRTVSASDRVIRGYVEDAATRERLKLATVRLLPERGEVVYTDSYGFFNIAVPESADSIKANVQGYVPSTLAIPSSPDSLLVFSMLPEVRVLDEIKVRTGGQKYSKKNNPAVELMERVRKEAPLSDPYRNDYYGYDRYEKIILGIEEQQLRDNDGKLPRKFDFLEQYSDTNRLSGSRIIVTALKELAATELYRKQPERKKSIITGLKSDGIDEAFGRVNIETFMRDVFRELDVYSNDMTLMQNRFVSPLSSIGANFYMYFITDTISIDGKRYAELTFAPHNPESFAFNGRMFVAIDEPVAYVKRVEMQVPKAINLNYVDHLKVVQDFVLDSCGTRHKTNDEMLVDLAIIPGALPFHVNLRTSYRNFSTSPNELMADFYDIQGESYTLPNADNRNDTFWEQYRQIPLSSSQKRVGSLMSRLRAVPFFYWAEKVLSVLVHGYIRTGDHSKFDFGPVNTFFSVNSLEGARFRVGGMTTAYLSSHVFGRGYVAYGIKDKNIKYGVEAEYSFAEKQYHSREFPMNAIRFNHSYDIDMIGQHYAFTNPDNFFLSLKRMKSHLATYRRSTSLNYFLELRSGFSLEAGIHHDIQEPSAALPFITTDDQTLRRFTLSSFKIQLRYAPGEKFYQAASVRAPINSDAPVIMLSHEFGPKGFLGANWNLNKTELSVFKRFWFSAFGYLDMIVKGGKIWSKVPYTALTWANVNLSYTIQPESFSLMNPMEFATDQYVSWDATYWANGALFNRIPFIKKLKLREVISFKGYYGGLTVKNNPQRSLDLLKFPREVDPRLMKSGPYMELSAGIDNILTFLRIDYVWRLSYRNTPNAAKGGVRVALHFTF